MTSVIYPYAFIAAFAGLLCWSFLATSRIGRLFRNLFLVGIGIWAATVYFSPLTFNQMMEVALRDLFVIGVGGLAMNWAKANKVASILVLVGGAIFLQLNYLDILRSSLKTNTVPYADHELLIDLANVDVAVVEGLLEPYQAVLTPAFDPKDRSITELDDYYLVDLPGAASEVDIIRVTEILQESGFIDWIEQNEEIRVPLDELRVAKLPPSDANIQANDPDVTKQWSFDDLDIDELHRILSLPSVIPKKTALIAIIDTGVDGDHEDLADIYISTKKAYDRDIQGHGTHVAGIAAAVSNNHIGIASFDPAQKFLQITGIKVLSDRGFGSQATIIKGMIEAADRGADVISMSLGGRSNDKKEVTYQKAVKYCNDKGAIVVVAAGNSNANAKNHAPANVDGVITVTAVNDSGKKATFSNTVEDVTFGIAAPGDNIYSTFPNNNYKSFRGTSMACPFVASLVGVMKSIEPSLSTPEIHRLLEAGGIDTDQTSKTGKLIQPVSTLRMMLD